MKRALLLAVALSAIAVGLTYRATADERDSITPVHALHAEQELECSDCHAEVTASRVGTDDLRPSMDTCGGCHDVEDDDECGLCHTNAEEPDTYVSSADLLPLFPHAFHAQGDGDCEKCHGDARGHEPAVASMETCRDCHATVSSFDGCGLCHTPEENLVPVDHTPDWLHLHGIDATWEESCASCHTQTDCQDCHSGDNVRPRSHTLDFRFEHALVARSGDTFCQSCHEESAFCADCHRAENVLPTDHSRGNWVLPSTGGLHAEAGSFDLESCIACHDQGATAPICAACHGE